MDRAVLRDLRSLSPEVADRVGRHLVVVGEALDSQPELAWAHAQAARADAGRLAVVREVAGLAAYRAGEFAEARAELRTARRMTGSPEHLPLLADCERALGRPERALELAHDPAAGRLERDARVELEIVLSGARRDLGEVEAAVVALQGPDLEDEQVYPWTARLWYAYADALLAAGRIEEATSWFASTAAVDATGQTDAEERLAELEQG